MLFVKVLCNESVQMNLPSQLTNEPENDTEIFLDGGFNPSEKKIFVNLDHLPKKSGRKYQKIFELPPPRFVSPRLEND